MVAAKQLATADQLGEGRLGLNVVAGWNKPEYDAFGINLPEKHADRYALAQEWFDVVTRIWNHQGPFLIGTVSFLISRTSTAIRGLSMAGRRS